MKGEVQPRPLQKYFFASSILALAVANCYTSHSASIILGIPSEQLCVRIRSDPSTAERGRSGRVKKDSPEDVDINNLQF